jgi:hypothetical protein
LRAGIAHGFELGFRMGFRLDDGGQNAQADFYGRPFDTETDDRNHDRVANPELRFRWSVARSYGRRAGIELRAYLPIESGSRFALMFGLPIALRAGPVRFDTGLYVPVRFYDPTETVVSVPLHIWIQAASDFWLGPILGLRGRKPGRPHRLPARLRPGWMTSRAVDIRTWFLFPDMNQEAAAAHLRRPGIAARGPDSGSGADQITRARRPSERRLGHGARGSDRPRGGPRNTIMVGIACTAQSVAALRGFSSDV